MFELDKSQYSAVASFLQDMECDTVSAYSIIENRQPGRVFVDDVFCPKVALFWHYCGFAIISGYCENEDFNHGLYKLLWGDFETNQKRFALCVDNATWNNKIVELLRDNANVKRYKRLRFRFDYNRFRSLQVNIPTGYKLEEVDECMLHSIKGDIIPSFSWNSPQAFLNGGKGYCLVDGKNIACTAFSSFIGNGQMDIGIDTDVHYRRHGFGTITAAAMVSYCLENGYEPVWGCREDNIGSARTANRIGFDLSDAHPFYSSL